MNKLISHIEFLLQSHDCVIIPGLGAVLAHGLPAIYDDRTGQWYAPSRAMSYNPELSRTDGLLAASVARRESISIDSATLTVRSEVEKMRKELEQTGHLSLGAAGSLETTSDGKLCFKPGEANWLSPSYMWLPSVAVRPLESAVDVAKRHAALERRSRRLPYLLRKGSRIAAAIAVLLALGWIVVQNLSYAPEEQYASVAPLPVSSGNIAEPAQDSSPVVLVLARAPKNEVIENIPASANVTKEDISTNAAHANNHRYYLIVASLESMAEAEKYVRQKSDTNLGILAMDGHYRVYAASGNTSEEVLVASRSEKIASRYPISWVCRR